MTSEIKNWFERHHLAHKHDMSLMLDRIVHHEIFWPLVIIGVFLALLIGATFMAMLSNGGSEQLYWPIGPYPYSY